MAHVHTSMSFDFLGQRFHGQQGISRMPSDVLTYIFIFYRDVVLNEATDTRHANTWIHITHVCQEWRRLAISTPLLWDRIHTGREHIARTWLARSRNVPLFVWLQVEAIGADSSMSDLMNTVLMHLPRIRRLRIRVPSTFDHPILDNPPWAGLSAPDMRELSLDVVRSSKYARPWIPELLLQSEFPVLTSLHVSDTYFRWMNCSLPRTLTKLHIRGLGWVMSPNQTTQNLMVFENLPRLEHLTFINQVMEYSEVTNFVAGPGWLAALPIISLPRLKTLSLDGVVFVCLHLLDHIIVPEQCTIQLLLAAYPFAEHAIVQWIAQLNSRLLSGPRASERTPITALSIAGYSLKPSRLQMKMWTAPSSDSYTTEPYFSIEFEPLDSVDGQDHLLLSRQWLNLLNAFVGGMDLAGVKTVHICEMHHFFHSMSFYRLFRGMPVVRTLCVHNWTLEQLADIFLTMSTDQPGEIHTALPNLLELELRNVNFPVRPLTYQDSHIEHSPYYPLDVMGLKAWKEFGFQIQKLVLKDCYNLTEEVVQRARLEVVSVKWDDVQQHGVSHDMLDSWENSESLVAEEHVTTTYHM